MRSGRPFKLGPLASGRRFYPRSSVFQCRVVHLDPDDRNLKSIIENLVAEHAEALDLWIPEWDDSRIHVAAKKPLIQLFKPDELQLMFDFVNEVIAFEQIEALQLTKENWKLIQQLQIPEFFQLLNNQSSGLNFDKSDWTNARHRLFLTHLLGGMPLIAAIGMVYKL